MSDREEDCTRAEFIADLDAGNVSEIVIQPNGEAPTGYLEIQMKNGLNHKLYATDITELETLVREYGFDPVVNDIERENWFLTYMLPMPDSTGCRCIPFHDDECPAGRWR